MNKSWDLGDRLYKFALRIIDLVNKLPRNTAGFELGKQLFKAGTSIAANYEEAKGAFSRDDFTYKMNTAFKEARECNLWLRLIKDSKLINKNIDDIIEESKEIRNILGKSVKTAKQKGKK